MGLAEEARPSLWRTRPATPVLHTRARAVRALDYNIYSKCAIMAGLTCPAEIPTIVAKQWCKQSEP